MQVQDKILEYLNSKDEYMPTLIDIIEDLNILIEKFEVSDKDFETMNELLEIQCRLFTEFGFRVYDALAEE